MLSILKSIVVAVIAVFCGIYLINPGFGFIELLPDNLPVIGNLDEATMAAILVACLRYFGFDLTKFFGTKATEKSKSIVDVE